MKNPDIRILRMQWTDATTIQRNTYCPICPTVGENWISVLDVQWEGRPTAVTEVTGRDVICGAGLCSMQ
jgi:hypothetical protein